MGKEQNPVYTALRNSIEVRREILETGIDAVKILQRYETIRDIKSKKMTLLNELKKSCDNVHRELGHFRKDLPSVDFKEFIKEKEKKHHIKHKSEHKHHEHIEHKEKTEEPKTHIDPLQHELNELRKRLENINIG